MVSISLQLDLFFSPAGRFDLLPRLSLVQDRAMEADVSLLGMEVDHHLPE